MRSPEVSAPGLDRLGAASLRGTDILVLSPTPTAPTDQGNRKRIHAVCAELKQRGARVHFVLFPQEWWFSFVPFDLIRTMSAEWHSFHLLTPRDPLYRRPAGDDYQIDEWWDEAIGDYLSWLFKRMRFDAFIVNYAYLSKAFEFAPAWTLRILDAHDKFTDRRKLLEDNGIAPEFFYTTQDQEAIATRRAHLVWAIKEEEAEFYRTLGPTPCITLPHIEPEIRIERRRRAVDEGRLVVGMLGSVNAINVSNARSFVREALPIIERRGAPVTLRFAGGMCAKLQDLAGLDGVDLRGSVDGVEEFYRDVDVVTVPLSFSTGLKIKAVEAFATGMPLVALGHALEGIPVDHPWHQCDSLPELVNVCCDIAREPELMERLRENTQAVYGRIAAMAAAAFDDTARRINAHPITVITIGREFFDGQSLYREHVFQMVNLVKQLMPVTLYVDQPLPVSQAAAFEAFDGLAADCKLVVAPSCGETSGRSLGLAHHESTLAELLAAPGPVVLWAVRVCDEVWELAPPGPRVNLVLRLDLMRMMQPEIDGAGIDALTAKFRDATLIDGDPVFRADASTRPARRIGVPFLRWKPAMLHGDPDCHRIDILVRREHTGLAAVMIDLLRALQPSWPQVRVVTCGSVSPAPTGDITTVAVERLLCGRMCDLRLPGVVIDLSAGAPVFEIYREAVRRAGLPVVEPEPDHESIGLAPYEFGLAAMLDLVEAVNRDHGRWLESAKDDAEVRYGGEAGWLLVWGLLSFRRLLC